MFAMEMVFWTTTTVFRSTLFGPKTVENAYNESVNDRFRDACLNSEFSLTFDDARLRWDERKPDCNKVRPHIS